MSSVKKVVLAYSGGLDTSIIIPWLKEHYGGAEVIAFCGDVGQGDDYDAVKKKAIDTGASKCVVEGPPGGVRPRLLLQGALRRGDLRGQLPPRHRAGASAAGLPPDPGGHRGRRRRPLPRRHREGQRPGALRGDLRGLRPPPDGDRSLARVGHPLPRGRPRLRRQARHPGGRARRRISSAGTGTSGTCPTRATTSRTSGTPRRKEMFKLTVDPMDAPDEPETIILAFEQGTPGLAERQAPGAGGDGGDPEPGRRGPRRGTPRPGGEPPRGHQVPRRLRDAGGDRAPPRPPRARAAGARPRHPALQAGDLGALRPAGLRRPVVLHPARGPGRLRGRDREGGHRRGPDPAVQGRRRRHRTPLASRASTARTWPPSARGWPTTTPTPGASSASTACPSGCGP